MKTRNLFAVMAIIASCTLTATGDVITPTSATSSTNVDVNRVISKAIDGSGLVDQSDASSELDDTHVYGSGYNVWLSNASAVSGGTEELTFDLGGTYNIDTVYHWPYTRDNNRNLLTFDISYSTDGGTTFSTPVSAASLGMANWGIQGNDRSDSVVETRTFSTLSGVTDIRFSNLQNHGGSYFALGEIRFGGQEVVVEAGPVDVGKSTVVASPTQVLADGTATSTITVTLKDANGIAVSGEGVTLANTSGSGDPDIIPESAQTTNSGGVATFTVSSNTEGTEVFTATASTDSKTITQTASVEFTAVPVVGPVNIDTSTVVASPLSVPANGSTTSTITVTLKDTNGLAVAGEAVTLDNTAGPKAAAITPIDVQSTDLNGQATFTVTSNTAGTEVFTANALDAGVTVKQTASVTFTEVAANQLVTLLDAPLAASTSATGGTLENLYNTSMSLEYIGTDTNTGNSFRWTPKDSDGYTGDSVQSQTVIYDMGEIITFDGFIHAQAHESDYSSIGSIDFWVSNTDPGSDITAIANTYFGTTPHASKALDRGDRLIREYILDGAKLTGRYVIMRWRCFEQDTDLGSPGGYTFHLGQTASVGDYDTWSGSYPGLGAPSDDDDLDGLSNEEERLLGLDPNDPGSINPFADGFDASAGTFSYTRRTQALTGMTYKIWYSTDLIDWFWESGANESVGEPVANIETVGVTIDPDLLDEPRLFLKLSVEDLGPAPVISSLWGANTTVTVNYSEAMGSSAGDPANYTVQEDGGGSVTVTGATLSGDGRSVTLTLGSALSIGSSFTVTTNRIANGAGQPLGNGTVGQFQTWDDDENGIKVFILAGQSNMVGYGHTETGQTGDGGIGTLRYFAQPDNDENYPEYDYSSLLVDPSQPTTSAWKTRPKVKLWWKNGASGELDGPIYSGNLGPLTSNGQWFGPEYGFGQVIGDFYPDDDILIIKTAWGGHKLAEDFRPPSAVAARGGEVGASYLEMFDDARQVLNNLGSEFPEWAGRRYQIVGVAWHQGTSDKSPIERATEYKYNLPDFISDVRAEFGKPNLPFVIATTGMSDVGPKEDPPLDPPYVGYHPVERAQLWVEGIPRPSNVLTDDTRGYWEEAEVSPRSQGFHWNGNARSYFRVGKGLGDKMVNLLSQ
ncbi:MAG: Ig-like domain-containing protein [Verrucomicrobiae bacterium]|nr:Ig-like domain-containing protein [Verrucomicrobiae bacterium]NNJ85696.1 hypothetical protein [Akkermansiaceae bacterium]